MNIFELFGTIAIQNKDANKAIDETGEKANGLASTMDKAFSKIGSISKAVGKAAVAGLAASTAAMGALMKKSIGNYADYEQLVGGVQTLFGDDAAKTVMENAQKAFQTAGMSANAYMETVTGFSASLVASLKGDTVKAADAADMALRDMSDNANKMGTDMTLIQNAYQGFAKQNYTMLDNLKLGYGGTQSEMKRLLKDAEKIQKAQGKRVKYSINSFADIVEAIHVVQDEMGITGTTAAEANDTISGSLASTKAAWENLVTGLADGNQDLSGLITSFVDSAKIAVHNITKVLPDLVSGFAQLIDGLAPEIPGILESILPSLIQGAVSLLSGLASALPGLMGVLMDQLPYILDQIGAAIYTIWTGVVWPAIQGLFSAVFGIELPDFETFANDFKVGWDTYVQPTIDTVKDVFGLLFHINPPNFENLGKSMDDFKEENVNPLESAWDNVALKAALAFDSAVEKMQEDYSSAKEAFNTNVITPLAEKWDSVKTSASDAFQKAQDWLNDTFSDPMASFTNNVLTPLSEKWDGIKTSASDAFQKAQDWLNNTFSDPMSSFTNNVLTPLSEKWESVKTSASDAFQKAKDWLNDKFTDPMANFNKNVVTPLAEAWSVTVSDAINSAKQFVNDYMGIDLVEGWDKVTNAVKSAWDTVVGIINNAISAVQAFLGINKEASSVGFGGGSSSGNGAGRSFGDNSKSSGGRNVAPAKMTYNASGAVFSKPTIFDTRLGYQVAGEAGPEAIAPIGVLQKYVSEAVASQNSGLIAALHEIRDALMDMDDNMGGHMRDALDGTALNVNKREFARLVKVVE